MAKKRQPKLHIEQDKEELSEAALLGREVLRCIRKLEQDKKDLERKEAELAILVQIDPQKVVAKGKEGVGLSTIEGIIISTREEVSTLVERVKCSQEYYDGAVARELKYLKMITEAAALRKGLVDQRDENDSGDGGDASPTYDNVNMPVYRDNTLGDGNRAAHDSPYQSDNEWESEWRRHDNDASQGGSRSGSQRDLTSLVDPSSLTIAAVGGGYVKLGRYGDRLDQAYDSMSGDDNNSDTSIRGTNRIYPRNVDKVNEGGDGSSSDDDSSHSSDSSPKNNNQGLSSASPRATDLDKGSDYDLPPPPPQGNGGWGALIGVGLALISAVGTLFWKSSHSSPKDPSGKSDNAPKSSPDHSETLNVSSSSDNDNSVPLAGLELKAEEL